MADEPPALNLDDIDFGPTMRGHQKGDRVFDRFVLQKLLGRGGMGVVWLAVDERLRRDVALKFAPQLIRYDEVAVEELKEETRKGLDLAHPNIVKTYDFLLDEENAAISMEFIDGESLSGLRLKQPKRIFEVREIELWVGQMLKALDYAHHSVGVIHRDLKPANLMVDRSGTLRVTDFGIARSISEAVNRATMGVGNSTGTLAYMSPQQADGRRPEITDDVYAFASTVYELLTGKPPFHSGNIGLQLRHEDAVGPTARRIEFGLADCEIIPPAWEETLLSCLQKDPTKRPANASELMQLLGLESHSTVKSTRLTQAQVQAKTAAVPSATHPPTSRPAADTSSLPLWKQDRAADAAARAAKTNPSAPPPVSPTSTSSTSTAASSSRTTAQSSDGGTKKSNKGLLVGVLVVAVLLMGGTGTAAWWAYTYLKEKNQPKVVHQNDPTSPVETDSFPTQDPGPSTPSNNTALNNTLSLTNDSPSNMSQGEPPVTPPSNPTPPMTQDPTPAPPAIFTIQDAINRAKRGDTITIPDGIYQEQVRLSSGIKLKAETPGKVVVQADGESGSALLSESCRDVSIEGLVFQHTGSEVASGRTWPVVYVKASSITITGCTVEKGVGAGMVVTGSGQVELRQCTFRNNVDHGLIVESGSEALVTECEARKNGGSGVAVRHTGTHPTFVRCVFDGNGGSGAVVIDGGSANIGAETISRNNVEAGIAADGEGVGLKVDGVTCENNLAGISVVNAAEGQIRRATVRSNKESGLIFDKAGDKSVAEENIVEKNKLDGIFASNGEDGEGGSLRIANNQVSLNGGYGILVFGKGFKPEVTENTSITNAQYGIFAAQGCSGSITGNTLKGNHLPGVGTEAPAGDIAIKDNIVE